MHARNGIAVVVMAAASSFALAGTASAATDRDCTDFASQAEAQAAYDAVPGDPERLDQDGDGIACETLSGGTEGPAPATPVGGVAAGDGSAADGPGALPFVVGGVALAGAGAAGFAARRAARGSA